MTPDPDDVLAWSLSGVRPTLRTTDRLTCTRCLHGFHGLPCKATVTCECRTSTTEGPDA